MSEPNKRLQRAFLLGLRRGKAIRRAKLREMEDDWLDEWEAEAEQRAALTQRDDDLDES